MALHLSHYADHFWVLNHFMVRDGRIVLILLDVVLHKQSVLHHGHLHHVLLLNLIVIHASHSFHRLDPQLLVKLKNFESLRTC